MRAMFRALALILVLSFATGTVVHAVQASDMALEMAMTADGTMPGCDGCGDDDAVAKLACAPACMAPAVAILGSDTEVVVELAGQPIRSEEHTSELQSLMRSSYAVFCLKKKKQNTTN